MLSAASRDAVPVRQHHDRGRADERADRLQRVEVERNVGHRRGQQAGRRPAGLVGLEGVAVEHAARGLDHVGDRRAGRQQVHAGGLHPARDRVGAQPLAAVLLDRSSASPAPRGRRGRSRAASRRCAPASGGRRRRPARRRAGGGAAGRACPRSIRSSPILRRRCRRPRRGAGRCSPARRCPAASSAAISRRRISSTAGYSSRM